MIKKILSFLIIIFFLWACDNNLGPNSEPENSPAWEEMAYTRGALKAFSIYQDRLPPEEQLFATPKELYASLEDPYTVYYTPPEAEIVMASFDTDVEAAIGVMLKFKNDSIYIKFVVPGSPAELAGIKNRDLILQVDGISFIGISDSLLSVTLDKNVNDSIEMIVQRDSIPLTIWVQYQFVTFPTVYLDTLDTLNFIPYIYISTFLDSTLPLLNGTAEEFKSKLAETNTAPITVLDLTGNPGGFIDETLPIVEAFLNAGDSIVLVSERSVNAEGIGTTKESAYTASITGTAVQRDFIVLIDSHSASASEILAAAILYNRPDIMVMGDSTFGKARGQTLLLSPAGGLCKITSLKFLTVNKVDYDTVGLVPHQILDKDSDWVEIALQEAVSELGGPAAKAITNRLLGDKIRSIRYNKKRMRRKKDPRLFKIGPN